MFPSVHYVSKRLIAEIVILSDRTASFRQGVLACVSLSAPYSGLRPFF